MNEIRHMKSLLALAMLRAGARVLQISIPRHLFKTSSNRDNVPHPKRNIIYSVHTSRLVIFPFIHQENDIYLSANSIAVSPGSLF